MTNEQLDEIEKLAEAVSAAELKLLRAQLDIALERLPNHVEAYSDPRTALSPRLQRLQRQSEDATGALIVDSATENEAARIVRERREARLRQSAEAAGELAVEWQRTNAATSDQNWRLRCEIKDLSRQRDEARAAVERLRDVVRQVHALASEAIVGTAVGAYLRMTEIHKITKGMVE